MPFFLVIVIVIVNYPTLVFTSTLTVCRRNRGDPSSLYRTWGALQVLQKHNRFGLAWSRPRADRGLSRPTSVSSVFRTTTNNRCVCTKLYPDRLRFDSMRAKNLFLSKNRAWPSLCLGLAVN